MIYPYKPSPFTHLSVGYWDKKIGSKKFDRRHVRKDGMCLFSFFHAGYTFLVVSSSKNERGDDACFGDTFFPDPLKLIAGGVILFGLLLILYRKFQQQQRKERICSLGLADLDRMDGLQFEQYLLLLFQTLGYGVELTPASRDFGADLILTKGGQRIVVQAKRHRQSVGISAVQQIYAAKGHYKADDAWVITNDFFTKSAITLAKANRIRLINRKDLTQLILSVHPEMVPIPSNTLKGVPAKEVICPSCGAKMIKRQGAYGYFYGCSNYPKCRHTQAV